MSTQQGTEAGTGAQVRTLVPGTEPDVDDTAELMHTVADGLAQHGLRVRGPEPGSQYLKISDVPGISCDVAIIEDGPAEWEYRMGPGD